MENWFDPPSMGRRRSGLAVSGPPVGSEPLADFLDFSTSNLERLRSIIRWNEERSSGQGKEGLQARSAFVRSKAAGREPT